MTQAIQKPQGTQYATTPEMSDFEKLLQKDFKMKMEYVPFLGNEKITLSPSIVVRYLCRPTKAGHVCTEDQATRFMMLCKARGLNPWEGDAFIIGYDTKDGPEFNLVTAHQAFLKRAEVHPEYDGMESGAVVEDNNTGAVQDVQGDFVDSDCTLVGGWARIHFKNRKIPVYRRLNLATFKKPFGVWLGNAAGMIVKCAEGDGLRSAFPNSLGGMYLEGEMSDSESPLPEPVNRRLAEVQAAKQNPTGGRKTPAPPPPATATIPSPPPGAAAPRNAPGSEIALPLEGAGANVPSAPPAADSNWKTTIARCPKCQFALAGGICPQCGEGRPSKAGVSKPIHPGGATPRATDDSPAPASFEPVSLADEVRAAEAALDAAAVASPRQPGFDAPDGPAVDADPRTAKEIAMEYSENASDEELEAFFDNNGKALAKAKAVAKLQGPVSEMAKEQRQKVAYFLKLELLGKK